MRADAAPMQREPHRAKSKMSNAYAPSQMCLCMIALAQFVVVVVALSSGSPIENWILLVKIYDMTTVVGVCCVCECVESECCVYSVPSMASSSAEH